MGDRQKGKGNERQRHIVLCNSQEIGAALLGKVKVIAAIRIEYSFLNIYKLD